MGHSAEITGFISFLGGFGHKPFQDGPSGTDENAVGPCLKGIGVTADQLAENAEWLRMHPKIRQAILVGEEVTDLARGSASGKRGNWSNASLNRLP